ncbi:hypothetical protein EAI30_08740 [Romboutsia ilealis]|nr:hypothetical protein [Romboutsia ilealis]
MKNKPCDRALGRYYYNDDLEYYQEYRCGVCNCTKFIQDDAGEEYEYQDEICSITDWYNYINDGFVDLECHCGEDDYVLVKAKEYGFSAWVYIEDYQTWKLCHNCGNEDGLERIISKEQDKMTMNCPKCKSEKIFEI